MTSETWTRVDRADGEETLHLIGAWHLTHLTQISEDLKALDVHAHNGFAVDGARLAAIDTSGALLLHSFLRAHGVETAHVRLRNFRPEHQNILNLIQERMEVNSQILRTPKPRLLQIVGLGGVDFARKVQAMIAFLGHVAVELRKVSLAPRQLRVRELFVQLEAVGLRAVPIVCLVTFLIGIVIAYLFGIQLDLYGAKLFIVDGVARAITRELSPMLVAIIVAGRSGATFTAHLGSMRVTEEIDAIITLGLSPLQVLVIPRVLALVIALPLLVFIGDAAGLVGSMVIAQWQFDISYGSFVQRLQNTLPLGSFYIGLVKAPVFAWFIAIIGCRMGLAVRRDAQSVALNTTSTVVQSIVSIILLDAAFAIVFVETGF